MKIKINDKWYWTAKIPKYNQLTSKLDKILERNKNEREYVGIANKGKLGILVNGVGNLGISNFQRFYSINDIHFYFNKHIARLKKL